MAFSVESRVKWRLGGFIHDKHGNIWREVLQDPDGDIPEVIARAWTHKYDDWPDWPHLLLVATFEDAVTHPRVQPVGILRRHGKFYLYQMDRAKKLVDVTLEPVE